MVLAPDDMVDLYEALLLAAEEQTNTPASTTDWARENVTVVTPWAGRIPFEPYDYQAAFLADTSPRRLILKARQVGMSNAIAIEAIHKAISKPDQMILMVSRNGDLAQHLITYCRHTLASLREMPELVRENLSELEFANGSRIRSLAATPAAGRGFPATSVYLDEFAFAEYAELIYQAIVPTLPPTGQLTVLSTANGRNNLFFRLWSGTEGGEWSRHSIHWSDCPRYRDDPTWEAKTRADMTRQSFAQEFDLDFIASGDAVFDPADLARCKEGWNPSPEGCERYINAWDIGRRHDHTVGITIGLRDDVWHVVKYDRVLEPYPAIQSRIDNRHRERKAVTVVESNGVGDPVIENLSTRAKPYTMTTKTKVQAIQALQLLIQQGRFKHDIEQLGRELGLYEWDDKDLVQDSVMSAAIAAVTAFPPTLSGVLANTVKQAQPAQPDKTVIPVHSTNASERAREQAAATDPRVRRHLAMRGGW